MSEKCRVFIVDDSVVFRSQIKEALKGSDDLEVVGAAPNGKLALEHLKNLSVDIVTMDLEMPEMDGVTTISEMRKAGMKAEVIVFSAQTRQGADTALNALSLGAFDFVQKPKDAGSLQKALEQIRSDLVPKIRAASARTRRRFQSKSSSQATSTVPSSVNRVAKKQLDTFLPAAIVIASSTGGPDALGKIFQGLNIESLNCPIFIAQHMPPLFTASLAKRLASTSGLNITEAKSGEVVEANHVYVAPGDFHLSLSKKDGVLMTHLDQAPKRNEVRPAADFLFESAASIFGSKLMGFVLTGMGQDGLDGSVALKNAGGGLMIQDEESCVVFGMPGAVFRAGVQDSVSGLAKISATIAKMCGPTNRSFESLQGKLVA